MTRSTTIISIFLASPSDVSSERVIVTRAIERWNIIRGRSQGYLLELLNWENSTSAAIGMDGQDVVNIQIGDNYDAMIAIFWTRLGSETPRANSGTVEEYERAIERHKSGNQVEIGVYFKMSNPPMSQLESSQLQGVFDLKIRMQNEGIYHKGFSSDDALTFEIDLFLDRLVQSHQTGLLSNDEIVSSQGMVNVKENHNLSVSVSEPIDDELGYIDIIESLESHTKQMTEFLGKSSKGLDLITETVSGASQRFNDMSAMGSPDPSDVKKVVHDVTVSLNAFSDTIEQGIDLFAVSMAGVASDSLGLIRVSSDFPSDEADLEEARTAMSSLLDNMDGAITSMSDFAQSVRGLQRMTVAFNQARKRATNNVDKMIEIMVSSQSIIREALHSIQ